MRLITALFMLIAVSGTTAEIAVVPLAEVWGHNFPGTKNIRDLDTIQKRSQLTEQDREDSAFWQIHDVLGLLPADQLPKQAFVVAGEGQEALKNARRVLVDGEPAQQHLPTSEKKSLVLFGYASGSYDPILRTIAVSKEGINVDYEFSYRSTMDIKRYLAIIPVGVLHPGKGAINVNCTGVIDRQGQPAPFTDSIARIFCRSSTYNILVSEDW